MMIASLSKPVGSLVAKVYDPSPYKKLSQLEIFKNTKEFTSSGSHPPASSPTTKIMVLKNVSTTFWYNWLPYGASATHYNSLNHTYATRSTK